MSGATDIGEFISRDKFVNDDALKTPDEFNIQENVNKDDPKDLKKNNEKQTPDIIESATDLGKIYSVLFKKKLLPLGKWAIPGNLGFNIVLATGEVFSGSESSFRLEKYVKDYSEVIPKIEKASVIWATTTLKIEIETLLKFNSEIVDKKFVNWISDTEQHIRQNSGGYNSIPSDTEEILTRLSPLGAGPDTIHLKRWNDELKNAIRKRVAAAIFNEIEASKQSTMNGQILRILFAHPESIDILKEYAKSTEKGTIFAEQKIKEAIFAIRDFVNEINENPDHIWRYPVLIVAGVTHLGLNDVYGFPEFAVDIGQVLGRSFWEEITFNLSLGLLIFGLVLSGVGAIGVIILDLALGGFGTYLTYLREHEQGLAAETSAFRPDKEKIALNPHYEETALAGSFALIAAISLIGKTRELLKVKPRKPHELTPPRRGQIDKTHKPTTSEKPTIKLQGQNLPKEQPYVILPSGKKAPPTHNGGGYHGMKYEDPEVIHKDGLPSRGNDLNLQKHTETNSNSDTAFRGTTSLPSYPGTTHGAAYWPGEGGIVVDIRGVASWDVDKLLQGTIQTPDFKYRGVLMRGENETVIMARVPPEKIYRTGIVEVNNNGELVVRKWILNPNFKP